jgi:hypothetical protein
MRNKLRENAQDPLNDTRPPIFLMPGLASTRLVAWKFKKCNFMSSDIRIQDNVWLNINLVIRMGSIDVDCMSQCLSLGLNQTDIPVELINVEYGGCKLRPDEGLDAIASLAPGGIGADLLVGGTNTVYAWLIQWLAENMGYDVTNIVGYVICCSAVSWNYFFKQGEMPDARAHILHCFTTLSSRLLNYLGYPMTGACPQIKWKPGMDS